MSDSLLEVKDLHVHFKTYEGTAKVLNGIDLTIDEGGTTALVGETGCGKSVTAKTILGLLPPSARIIEGSIYYKDRDLLSLSDAERHSLRGKEISMIPQDPMSSLNPVFTIGEQMVDVLRWQGKPKIGVIDWIRASLGSDSDLRERAIDMLDRVQIPAPDRVFSSYPHEISGGMRQRVLIAIALLSEPDLIIADEPGTALDVTTEAKILELLNEMIDSIGTSVMYITHDLGVAREVSDDINVMYAGEIVEQSPAEELFALPLHPYTRGLLNSIPRLAEEMGEGIEGQLPNYTAENLPACRFSDRCPFAQEECEEVFPYRRDMTPEHTVACHLYDGPPSEERYEALAMGDDVDIGEAPWADQIVKSDLNR